MQSALTPAIVSTQTDTMAWRLAAPLQRGQREDSLRAGAQLVARLPQAAFISPSATRWELSKKMLSIQLNCWAVSIRFRFSRVMRDCMALANWLRWSGLTTPCWIIQSMA